MRYSLDIFLLHLLLESRESFNETVEKHDFEQTKYSE